MPGDIVAVGPTGDTESTLTTDPEPAPSSAPEADYSAVGHSGDPVAVDPEALGATTGTDEAWAPGGSGPGEDRGVRDTGGEGVVARNYADEDITTEDVVARDFANRDISGEGVVERDFANRDITERDIAHGGINPESAGAPISEPDADGLHRRGGAAISEPTSHAADDGQRGAAPIRHRSGRMAFNDPDDPSTHRLIAIGCTGLQIVPLHVPGLAGLAGGRHRIPQRCVAAVDGVNWAES